MKKILLVVPAIFALILSACGSAVEPTTNLNVTMTDFVFTPNEFVVPAGQEITLHIINNGAVVHNFVIMKLGTTAGETFDEEDQPNVYWEERDIPPGGDLSVTFMAPAEPGEYQVVCRTPGHITSGMLGKLIVVAPDQ
ncbi:MAG TPA: cupredoxin domain-containing protein [Anaerolineales bacterium]|nr:cupredoxin domain-containing protein [Anaerolineales bacterium]